MWKLHEYSVVRSEFRLVGYYCMCIMHTSPLAQHYHYIVTINSYVDRNVPLVLKIVREWIPCVIV